MLSLVLKMAGSRMGHHPDFSRSALFSMIRSFPSDPCLYLRGPFSEIGHSLVTSDSFAAKPGSVHCVQLVLWTPLFSRLGFPLESVVVDSPLQRFDYPTDHLSQHQSLNLRQLSAFVAVS